MSFYKINGNLINIQCINSIFYEGQNICILQVNRNSDCVCVNCNQTTPCLCNNSLYKCTLLPSDPDYESWKNFIDGY